MNETYPVQVRMLNLTIVFTEVFCVIGMLTLTVFDAGISFFAIVTGYMAVIALIWVYGRVFKRFDRVALLYVYLTNIIFLPALFVMNLGMYGGAPLLLVAGYIIAFLLLEGWQLLVAGITLFIWDTLIACFVFYYPERLSGLTRGMSQAGSIIFAFVTTALLAIITLSLYSRTYKNLKDSIQLSHRHIESAGRVKSRFLASITGEFKTPMNAILTMAELLERGNSNKAVTGEISTIKKNAFSLLEMINNVTTYATLLAGGVRLANRQFHFGSMLRDLIYTMSVELADIPVRFNTQVDPDIPDALYGDESKIRQVFKYILNGCVRSTGEGRINLEVGYENVTNRNSVMIKVRISDTGWGFTEDEKEAVFNSFERYDSRKYSQLKLVGLELSICRELLRLMNGDIRVESLYFVGTAISFEFEIFPAEKSPVVERRRNSGRRVLILTDKYYEADALGGLFGDFGAAYDIASNSGEFKARLDGREYDHIMVAQEDYESVKVAVGYGDLDNRCYIITDYKHRYGDFGGCRIIRRPVSALNIGDIINDDWRSTDYMGTLDRGSFQAPDVKALVVDNNMMDLHLVAGFLDRYSMITSIATSGREAIDKCSRQQYDVVLLNESMPVMDGYDTLVELKKLFADQGVEPPVICMSSVMKYEAREDLVEKGFFDILTKPVKRGPLETVLRECLGSDMIRDETMPASDGLQDKDLHFASLPEQDKEAGLIDMDIGLMHSGGDESAYHSILSVFCSDGLEKLESIRSQSEDEDLKLFTISVHAVKGASAGIGAVGVSEQFKALEAAGKNGDRTYIASALEGALDDYGRLLGYLKDYLVSKGAWKEEKDVSALEKETFDINEMKQILRYAEDFETRELEECVRRLENRNFGEEVNSYISAVSDAVESFEYDRIIDLAEEFISVYG